jgi:hypothetical protein
MGGTVTAEHGIGAVRRDWLPIQRGDGAVAVMRSIKAALDPQGILNPGRVLQDSRARARAEVRPATLDDASGPGSACGDRRFRAQ